MSKKDGLSRYLGGRKKNRITLSYHSQFRHQEIDKNAEYAAVGTKSYHFIRRGQTKEKTRVNVKIIIVWDGIREL